jgi:hypothetical protein
MSRRTIPLVFAALLLSGPLGAAPVPAGGPKPDDSVSPTAVKLLQHRKIQKELKMTAEQRVVIFDGLADLDEEHEKKLDELAKKPDAADADYEKLDKELEKATDKLLASVANDLTAAQRARLRQLDWRLRGPAAFADPQVEKKLQLTDTQKKKAADAAERMKTELNRYVNAETDDEAKQKAALLEFRKARLKEMEDMLTADQKTSWTTMLGTAPTGFVVDDFWLKIELDVGPTVVPGIGK